MEIGLVVITALFLAMLLELTLIIWCSRSYVFKSAGPDEDIKSVSEKSANRALTFGGLIFAAMAFLIGNFSNNLNSIQSVLFVLAYSFSLSLLSYKLEVLTGYRRVYWIIQDKLLSYAFLALLVSLILFFLNRISDLTFVLLIVVSGSIFIHLIEAITEHTYYERRSAELKKKIDKSLDAAKISAIIFSFMVLLNFLIQIYFFNYLKWRQESVSYFYLSSLIPFFLLFYYFRKRNEISFKDIGFTFKNWKKNFALGVIIGISIGLLGWVLLWLLNIEMGYVPKQDWIPFILILFPSLCISAPLWEEIAFRGLFLNYLENFSDNIKIIKNRKYSKGLLIVLIMALFPVFVFSFDRPFGVVITIFITSLIYVIGYLKLKSIILPIIAHSIFNFFMIIRPIIVPIIVDMF